MRLIWSLVGVAAVVALVGSFVVLRDGELGVHGLGVFFVTPLGALISLAIAGLRERWSRGLAVAGAFAALVTLGIAGFLHGALGAGRGIGTLLAAVARQTPDAPEVDLLGLTALGALVALAGCLVCALAGPRRHTL